jgi:hypothetical protein
MGVQGLSYSHSLECWVSVYHGGRPLSTSRVADCHSVKELWETWLFCRELQHEALGFCVPQGNRTSGATSRVTGYSFPPLSGKSSILGLWQGGRAPLLSGTVESAGPPCSVWREASWSQKKAKPGAWVSLRCVVAGSWHWIVSWGFPWGQQSQSPTRQSWWWK